jgi:enamine deaminase RidA (YjgF/YER057c/UK114 family)
VTRRRVLNPVGHYQPIRPYYSQAVRVDAGSLLFTSAEAPFDVEGNLVGLGDAAVQMRQCIENLAVTVAAAGASLDDVISMDVLLTDVEDFDRIAPIREEYFPTEGPAAFLAAGLVFPIPGMLLEIRAVVAVPGPDYSP